VAAAHLGQELQVYSCRLRATQPGRYHVLPARAWLMYDPDDRTTTEEFELIVAER
jgi:uncharacterized protein YfaS (alpha-2-macroglobulin family)